MPLERDRGLSEGVALRWTPAEDTANGAEVGARAALTHLVSAVRSDLEALQRADGHWIFELEADATSFVTLNQTKPA